ncbi:MAG TPA: methyltransferase domain-containing protein [Kofleriaceae bacterium]|nr:methyltransferase domain-containing protein [Kofleriaceae bacterium]
MRVLLSIVLAGCAAVTPPPLDVIAASHDAVVAYDHADVTRAARLLGSDFVELGRAVPLDRDHELEHLRARKTDNTPVIANRTWSEEHTVVAHDQAVFVGRAAEVSDGKGYTYDGRYTLVWRIENGAWKVASLQWARVEPEAERFDDVYRSGHGFETAPNKLLVSTIEKLPPGTALDLMCGQGRNALYEASRGWRATGIDYSAVGIDQARRAASERKLEVELVDADLDKTALGEAKYDLVSMLYAGADPKLIAKAQAALKPGGTFVYEYFAAGVATMEGAKPGELAKLFDGYDITLDEQVDDVPDWAMAHAKLQRFVARKPATAK